MKLSELRIGNFIEDEGKILPIISIDSQRNHEELKGAVDLPVYDDKGRMWTTTGRWIERINPIPLTVEWLKKLKVNEKLLETIWSIRQSKGQEGSWVLYYGIESSGIYIEYVHELQNLYYTLTKEELVLAAATFNTKTNGA